jgi:hypothetical protein
MFTTLSVFVQLALFAIATCRAEPSTTSYSVSPCEYNEGGMWKIGTAEGMSPYCLSVSDEPSITCETIGWNPPSSFVADPFLVFSRNCTGQEDAYSGPWYAFYEMMCAEDEIGKIGVAVSEDEGDNWEHLGTALDVGDHLSYPGVYDDPVTGKRVLIPENIEETGIQVFETDDFPFGWSLSHVFNLDDTYGWADPTLVYWENMWYCFLEKENVGYIFYSSSLFDDQWTQHPQSPFSVDARYLRCGGPFTVCDGQLWRISQDKTGGYGVGVHLLLVEKLTPMEFSETPMKSMMAKNLKLDWAADHFHHISGKEIAPNQWFALVDGFTWE